MSVRVGGEILVSWILIGPGRIFDRHCSTIRTLCRISATRTR